ncbi:MAG: putative porin [Nitrospinales bacterium]
MQKRVSVLFATFLLFFTFVAFSWVFVPASSAAVQVGDKLSLFGDFRFRYEIDDEDDPAGDRERDRARIRARFGFKYDWSNRVNFGLRLRTESDNNQSPHQTLGVLTAGQNADFGLDRAYINVKYLDGGFAWLGKHGISWWEQNEAFWDADIQPEGAGLGYKFNFGEAGTFTLQSVFTYLTDNSFTGDGDGIFDDDTATSIQGVYNRKWEITRLP